MLRSTQTGSITFFIWLIGAVAINRLYNFLIGDQPPSGFFFCLIILGYGYAWMPIHQLVKGAMPTEFVTLDQYQLEIVYRSGHWEGRIKRNNHIVPKPGRERLLSESREELIKIATERVITLRKQFGR